MQRLTSALEAFRAFSAFYAQMHSLWVFVTMRDDATCDECDSYDGELVDVLSDDDLYELFEYGDMVGDGVFKPNVHPNCRCILTKVYEGE